MQISLDTALTTPDELTALIALCASLGGRLPEQTTVSNMVVKLSADTSDVEAMVNAVREQLGDDVPAPPAAEITEGNFSLGGASEPAQVVTSGESIELDADGIPWDERIHASTKTKTPAGVWTKKRKVDEVLYGQIHAELQELHASEGATDGPLDDTPPPPASNTPDENAPTDDTDVPPPPAPDVSAGSDVPEFGEFADLVNKVAPFGLPYVKLAELAVKVTDGLVTKFPDLRDKPDYWADFYELVKSEAG